MKCVCRRECYIANSEGRHQQFSVGQVVEFVTCPDHFVELGGQGIDFATAGEEELLEAEYELDELKAFIEKKYDRKSGNRGKERTVALLLDCRYRELDFDPNTMV